MSIKLRFNVVIVRKLSIESSYPGGLEGLRTEWKPYSEDEHLIAFSSMGQQSTDLVQKLLACGLEQSDIAFGDEQEGIYAGCDWLEVRREKIGVTTCWLNEQTLP